MQAIVEAAFRDPLNQFFSIVILGIAVAAVLGSFIRSGPLARLASAAPALLTAMGVLGTFVGILLGLLEFNVADISRSVPKLLDGMKTAFVTSVFGMGSGIAVKLISELAFRSTQVTEQQGVEDVIIGLNALRAESERARIEIVGSLDKVRGALSGDSESSLITQLQRLRTDIADEIKASRRAAAEGMSAVTAEIRAVSTALSETASKAFIEALERTIREFNERITEQFGENFKQLNIAVGRLLEWQENYRQQMVTNAEALREGAAGIAAARNGLEAIGLEAAALVRAAGDMRTILEALGKTREELDARLGAFRDMATAAITAMPTIQARIEELTSGFSREVTSAVAQVAHMTEEVRLNLEAQSRGMQQASLHFVEVISRAAASASETATKAGQSVQLAMIGMADEIKAARDEQGKMLAELSKGYTRLGQDAATVGTTMQGTIKLAGEELRQSLKEAADGARNAGIDSIRALGEQIRATTDAEFRRIAASLDNQV